jgi:hypothetical protein
MMSTLFSVRLSSLEEELLAVILLEGVDPHDLPFSEALAARLCSAWRAIRSLPNAWQFELARSVLGR